MTLNIIAEMRQQLAAAEAIASLNAFDPATALRLFTLLSDSVDDMEALVGHAIVRCPELVAIGGPLLQHETPPSAPRPGLMVINGGRS